MTSGASTTQGRQHLVLTVHGIRTFGAWQYRFEGLVNESEPGVTFEHYRYGYFTIVAFLIPPVRYFAVRRFASHLHAVCTVADWKRIDIVAHSFGTHLVGWALHRMESHRRPKIHTVVLAGSVLRPTFPWRDLWPEHVRRVVNECALYDVPLIFSHLFVLLTGMAGRDGFVGWNGSGFRNRYYAFGHSGFFSDHVMAQQWRPLLLSDGAIAAHDEERGALYGPVQALIRNLGAAKVVIYLLVAWLAWSAIDRSIVSPMREARELAKTRAKVLAAMDDQWLRPWNALRLAREAVASGEHPEAQAVLQEALGQQLVERVIRRSGVPFSSAAISEDGNYIIATDVFAQLCVWLVQKVDQPKCFPSYGTYRVGPWSVRDHKLLLAKPDPGDRQLPFELSVVDLVTGQERVIAKQMVGPLTSAAWSPRGDVIAYGSFTFRAYLVDVATGAVRVLVRHSDIVNSVRFNSDGTHVVTTSQDGIARIFAVGSGALVKSLRAFSRSLFGAEFKPGDELTVVTADAGGVANLWPAQSKSHHRIAVHRDGVRDATWSPDGSLIVTASTDGTARLWSSAPDIAGKPSPLFVFPGHRGGVVSATFSPDGTRVLTASLDGTLRLWRTPLAAGKPAATLSKP